MARRREGPSLEQAAAAAARSDAGIILYNAVRGDERQLVAGSLDRGADPDVLSREEPKHLRTPLRAAAHEAKVRIVRLLLDRGALAHAHFGHDRWTALHSASAAGHDHVARLLISELQGSCNKDQLLDGFALTHILAECANAKLANHGADLLAWALRLFPGLVVDARSERVGYPDWTPLHVACARGWTKAAAVLLRSDADLHARTGDFHVRSPLVCQFTKGDPALGAQVAGCEPGFDQLGEQWLDKGLLPIHLAAFGGHLKAVQMLVRLGQSINATTEQHHWTPLMFAVWSGNVPLVREMCRLGAREVVNFADRRQDGSEWTPLALAVMRWGAEMVEALLVYGADPLVRLSAADFPGRKLLAHVAPSLQDAEENRWSGPDQCVSLLHLAVLRGCPIMLRKVLPLIRAVHGSLSHGGQHTERMHLPEVMPWRSSRVSGSSKGAGSGTAAHRAASSSPWRRLSRSRAPDPSMAAALAALGLPAPSGSAESGATGQSLGSARSWQEHQAGALKRLQRAPEHEGPGYDPVAFCTAEGWSPAVLAALLHTVDPLRQVRPELVETFPETSGTRSSEAGGQPPDGGPSGSDHARTEVFLELIATGRALLEDCPEASPPTVPQRFPDVCETLAARTVDSFVQLCSAGGAERAAFRVSHATLCAACRFNRMKVVKHMLEAGLCDPCCRFLKPVEYRPLHIAAACGFGLLAQLLLEHRADAYESDEHLEMPVYKLVRCYTRQILELQTRVAELELHLSINDGGGGATATSTTLRVPARTTGGASRGTVGVSSVHTGGEPGLTSTRFEAWPPPVAGQSLRASSRIPA